MNIYRQRTTFSGPFYDAVTLKGGQGRSKWYELVQLGEYTRRAVFDNYHIHSVRENSNVKVYDTPHYIDSLLSHASQTMHKMHNGR